jgi:4'-phosphopantetheinyl transferase
MFDNVEARCNGETRIHWMNVYRQSSDITLGSASQPSVMVSSCPIDVHVWHRDAELLDHQALESSDQTLSRNERARRDKFLFSEDRRDFAMAHDLLRRSLSKYDSTLQASEWQFTTTGLGKPYISRTSRRNKPIQFSLSHTNGFAACAISSTKVGIDVERINRNLEFDAIAERYFGATEIRSLNELPNDSRRERFFELWILKEAFLKAIGSGLSGPLSSCLFDLESSASVHFEAPRGVNAIDWKFALFAPHPKIRMAVAVKSNKTSQFLARGAVRLLVNGS